VGSEEEESRRLFYVAVTRARKQVVISWAKRDNKDKELEKSRFVAELLEDGQVDTRPETALGDEALLAFGNTSLLADDPARLPTSFIDTEFVDKLLEKYSLSVTHLNSYLRCPVTFYFNTLLRVPAPLNAALTFGSAVHYALEQVFRKMKNNSQRFPDSEVLLEGFRWFMARHETALSASEYRRRLEYGEQILPQFYEIRRPHWKHDVLVEYPFRNILLDDVPLNGKLDLMELSGNHITVVDYKTGNPANARKKMKPPAPDKVEKALLAGKEPAADDLLGGDYWRQAVFYRILVENEPNRRRLMSAARFEFVEPERDSGEYKCTSFEVSDEEVEIVKQQIKDVYGKIKAKQFENGCNKPECEWCNFVKRLKVVRHQEEAKG
jgi:DNA helicase-2/ATP-dependent DNA helicase PcrA